MYRIDLRPTELACEVRHKPFGVYGPELHELIMCMRSAPALGRRLLFMSKPHREWRLGSRISEKD